MVLSGVGHRDRAAIGGDHPVPNPEPVIGSLVVNRLAGVSDQAMHRILVDLVASDAIGSSFGRAWSLSSSEPGLIAMVPL